MKHKLLIFIFTILSSLAIGQHRLDSLTIDSLERVSKNLSLQLSKSSETNRQLEQTVTQLHETSSVQYSLISGFGVIYTIITIIIAIVAIIIPLLTYFFSIKPSRDLLNSLEARIDNRLEEYLKNSKQRIIDTAIENLFNESEELRNNAISFLSISQHEFFSEIQLFNIYRAIKSDSINSSSKITLAFILTSRENTYATEYCKSILKSRNLYNEIVPSRYFGMIGIDKYINVFKEYLTQIGNSNEKIDALLRIISTVRTVSLKSVLGICNSSEILSLIEEDEKKHFERWRLTNYFEYGNEQEMVKQTQLYSILNDK